MLKNLLTLLLISISIGYSQINNDANNRFMLGQSYLQSGDYQRAKSIFEELYKSNPLNPQYFQSLNDVYIQLKDYASAMDIIRQKISASPVDINLYGMLGSVHYLKGEEEEAYKIWDDAIGKTASNPINYRVIANYAIERRAFEKAIEILKKGKSVSEDKNLFSYDLANLYSLTMRFKEAAEEYCLILTETPNHLNSIESRIYSYVNKPEALKQTIAVFEDCRKEDNINFSYLLARLYKEEKSFDKSYEIYKKIDKRQGVQGAELFNFAQMVYNEGEYKLASKVFNEIVKEFPKSNFISNAKLGYAKTTEALIMQEEVLHAPSWKTFYSVKNSSSEKVKDLISAYTELTRVYPRSDIASEALLRIGKLRMHYENNHSGARESFTQIITDVPLSRFAADAYEGLADLSLLEGNLDDAESNLKKINNSRTEQEKKNLAKYKLANIYFYRGQFDQSKEIISKIMDNLKDNNANDAIELSLLLNTTMNDSSNLVIFAEGELLAEQKKFDTAKEKFQVVAQNPKGFMLNHLAKLRVAEMELAMDSLETSIELFGLIADENEKNIYADKALYLLGKIYQFGLNDASRALEIYESLLAKFPNSLYLDEAREEIIKLRNKLS